MENARHLWAATSPYRQNARADRRANRVYDALAASISPVAPSDVTTASFGEFSLLPLYLSAMMVIEPSSSVRVTRRPACSQVIRRPSRSMVLPLEFNDG